MKREELKRPTCCLLSAVLSAQLVFAGQTEVALSPERVRAIKSYLAAQACPLPKIDAENYGEKSAVPQGREYYGHTDDPLPKLKGFEQIGHLPDRDAADTSSRFLSAGLEMGSRRFGVEIVPCLKAAGFKRARLAYSWRQIERKKGEYDFRSLDEKVDALIAAGIEPWFYGGYGNELYYERKVEVKNKNNSVFWDAPCYHGEEAMAAWFRFVEAVGEHYKGRVRLYEIWNELDWRWFKDGEAALKELGPIRVAQDYTAFYRRTVEILKRIDPSVQATVSVAKYDSPWLIALSRTGLPELVDLWTYHSYRRSAEEGVRDWVKRYGALMRRRDGSLPEIVMGESGRGVGPKPTSRFITRTEYVQAKFVVRRMFFDMAMGAKFCNLFDVGDGRYGIFKLEERTPRLAWYVIRALGSVFDGLEYAPDLYVSYTCRGRQTLESQVAYNGVECHAYRRKGVPVYVWWVPEHLDLEGEQLFGRLTTQSGLGAEDNFKNPILIDPVRRTVWDVKNAVWSGEPGWDMINMTPANGTPYVFTDLSIFNEYVP